MRKSYLIKRLLLMVAVMALTLPVAAQDYEEDERAALLTKQYDELIDYWGGDNVIVKKNGKMGVVNADNKLFIPLQYDSIQKLEHLYYVWQNDKMGLISSTGSTIIPIKYALLQTFGTNEKYYFVAIQGDIECLDQTAGDFEACGVTCGILDSIGRVVIPFSHNFLVPLETFGNDEDDDFHYLAKFNIKQQHIGVIDMAGQEVLPMVYDNLYTKICYGNLIVGKESKYGIINMKGEEIIPIQYDKTAFDGFSKALAFGKKIGETDGEEQYQYGFWDLEGHQLSDMVFSDVEANIFGYILQIDGKTYYTNTMSFNEGFTPFYYEDEESIVEESPSFGYLDRQGRVAIKPQFSSAEPFSDGLAGVGLPNDDGDGELYGYIDTSGKMVVPAIYSAVSPFVAGLGVVTTTDGEVIVIDKQGNRIMEVPGYDAEIIVDDNGLGLTLIKVTGYDDNVKFYDRTGKLIKMLVDGEYLYPRP
jgi:hypothetical protein